MAACRHVWGRVRVLPVLVLVLVPVLVRSAALSAGLSSSSPGPCANFQALPVTSKRNGR